ncbi:MAG: hypothetical protein K8R36_20050 [Planctomycetales bacterium]|nr:hypothetical protein [Planctomycetales bacterium]
MLCNGTVATVVVLHVLLLRWLGMVFDLRLPFVKTDEPYVACPVTGT